jgi:dihydrofolate reductase
MAKISIIAALGKDGVIGKNKELLWRIPDDLKRFKRLTTGHPIIMGRKTHESIGRPLLERINIVVTRDKNYSAEGCVVTHSLEEALRKAVDADKEEIFVIGGGEIYKQALPRADKLYLTLIEDDKEGDVFFPDYSMFKNKTLREERDFEGLKYTWVTLER